MKRMTWRPAIAAAGAFIACAAMAYAQTVFKVPFEFKAGGKKLLAGEYSLAVKPEGQIVLKKEPAGAETVVPFTQRLSQPTPPLSEPQLVFHEVGDFAPSYTEYMTVYVLAEVWLPGEDGYLIHTTKGAHKNKVVTGQPAAK